MPAKSKAPVGVNKVKGLSKGKAKESGKMKGSKLPKKAGKTRGAKSR